jgi:hypothetical protein
MKLRWALDVGESVLRYIVEIELVGLWRLDLAFKRVQTICELFYVACSRSAYHVVSSMKKSTHPLLGPRFIGCLLNWHRAPVLLQLEQASGPFSLVASHLICHE